ncbi:hypothetical protein [Paenibacillus alkaliterrae]
MTWQALLPLIDLGRGINRVSGELHLEPYLIQISTDNDNFAISRLTRSPVTIWCRTKQHVNALKHNTLLHPFDIQDAFAAKRISTVLPKPLTETGTRLSAFSTLDMKLTPQNMYFDFCYKS